MSKTPDEESKTIGLPRPAESLSFGAIPHRFHQFDVPNHAPHFDRDDCRWTSIVGHFFRPIISDPEVKGFVFLNHNPNDVELRFASAEYQRIETKMSDLQKVLGITSKTKPTDAQTISGNAFRGGRWIDSAKIGNEQLESRRSDLVFRFLHAGCELFLDNLVQEGAYWRMESNDDKKENPLGNSFESLLHLISNFSEAKFDVFLCQVGTGVLAATAWMPRPVPLGSVRCHL